MNMLVRQSQGACIYTFGTWASMVSNFRTVYGQHTHTHTHTWLKNRRTQYSRPRLWVDLQGRYITLGEQVPVVKVNTFNVLRKAKCSSKTCIEKNLLDCPSSLLCPANVSTLRSNAISLMKPLLADSLGKWAISSSVHHVSLFIPYYRTHQAAFSLFAYKSASCI